jgi:hypothetical protein
VLSTNGILDEALIQFDIRRPKVVERQPFSGTSLDKLLHNLLKDFHFFIWNIHTKLDADTYNSLEDEVVLRLKLS